MSEADAEASTQELMDRVYRRQRHIYDLTRKYFLLGRDHLIRELKAPEGGSILEIGCGTGRNLIAASRAYPGARLFGLDISSAMLAKARANLRQAGLEGRIVLAMGDAASFDAAHLFGRAHFDRVFFSYSLSMIPAWRAALVQALRLADPETGRLLVVDFGGQDRLPIWFRDMLFAWLARFHVTPRLDVESALAELLVDARHQVTVRSFYRGYACFAEVRRGTAA
jgi:S-adenosylmethionine-diacylgycerolhomoserine-N-methlytransferase